MFLTTKLLPSCASHPASHNSPRKVPEAREVRMARRGSRLVSQAGRPVPLLSMLLLALLSSESPGHHHFLLSVPRQQLLMDPECPLYHRSRGAALTLLSPENSVWRRREPEVPGRSVYVDFRMNENLGSFHICDQKPPWPWRDSCRARAVSTDGPQ